MTSTAFWVIGLSVIFVLGSIMGLRISPREKALGLLRERARKLDLQPRLVPAPTWIEHKTPSGKAGGMVALYHLIVAGAQFPLLQAKVVQGRLQVVSGSATYQHLPFDILGAQAIEMQSNSVCLYWDENADLHGTQLDQIKACLTAIATHPVP